MPIPGPNTSSKKALRSPPPAHPSSARCRRHCAEARGARVAVPVGAYISVGRAGPLVKAVWTTEDVRCSPETLSSSSCADGGGGGGGKRGWKCGARKGREREKNNV
ncbi:hypothetical protein TRAPUB_11381 [Trametes pubescens]|uniref:Uncharacterized protein n=1 Tax=Trametes pubescens TaxID=154538 RepID=A0A1M2VWT0_TRAPU|nr:hypothetical protein TRAPUB_11381 [Trametes pubescens]